MKLVSIFLKMLMKLVYSNINRFHLLNHKHFESFQSFYPISESILGRFWAQNWEMLSRLEIEPSKFKFHNYLCNYLFLGKTIKSWPKVT